MTELPFKCKTTLQREAAIVMDRIIVIRQWDRCHNEKLKLKKIVMNDCD